MGTIDYDRFSGFAGLYASVRPRPPAKVTEIAFNLLGRTSVEQVVDLGSGTGLSTSIWRKHAASVIGIEPTADMRNQAKADFPEISFLEGSSYATGLLSGSTDIVCCSQSFHWMEPRSTLQEVNRILRPDGLFLVYDCLWPVTWDWRAELRYVGLVQRAKALAEGGSVLREGSHQYPKERHRPNLEASGHFAHVGTVHFDHCEDCDAQRFVGMALSQGLVQSLLKVDPALLAPEIEALQEAASLAAPRQMRVSYVLHYGVKGAR